MNLGKVESVSDLIDFLKIDVKTFNKITYAPSHVRYATFEINKKNGGKRRIQSPIKDLKGAQQKISEQLYKEYKSRPHVHGYIKAEYERDSKGILTNATHHSNKKWIVKIDIQDFFENITSKRVFGVFKNHPFYLNNQVAVALTKIVTFEGHLAQGAPSSPIISNLICRRLDHQLAGLAKKNHCSYTRYADDITFSTNKKTFPHQIAHSSDGKIMVGNELVKIIEEKNDLPINHEKTRLIPNSQRQVVTGLVVNKKPNIQKNFVKHVRAILHHWEKTDLDTAEEIYYQNALKNYPSHSQEYRAPLNLILRGKVEYIGYIKGYNSKPYINLSRKLALLDSSFFPKKKPFKIDIYCEGKTDYIYIKAAQKFFEERGEYKNIDIHIPDDFEKEKGDASLLTFIEQHSERVQSDVIVGIFDNDTKTAKKLKPTDGDVVKDWGNNVYSILLNKPEDWVRPGFCVEDLFEEGVLTTPIDGRRFYRPEEFDIKNRIHKQEPLVCQTLNTVIIDCDVYNVETRENVALSKKEFADRIQKNKHPFGNINFEGFRQIFTGFEMILSLSDNS